MRYTLHALGPLCTYHQQHLLLYHQQHLLLFPASPVVLDVMMGRDDEAWLRRDLVKGLMAGRAVSESPTWGSRAPSRPSHLQLRPQPRRGRLLRLEAPRHARVPLRLVPPHLAPIAARDPSHVPKHRGSEARAVRAVPANPSREAGQHAGGGRRALPGSVGPGGRHPPGLVHP